MKFLFEEFKKILPVSLFFLVAFLLVDTTEKVVNKNGLNSYNYVSCVIAALIMGKIVLIADYMRLMHLMSDKPLIYVTLWKSFLYVACSIVLRIIEHAIPDLFHGATLSELFAKIVAHIERPLFWIAQVWLAYLFIIFVAYRELINKVGPGRVRELFFGK